MVVRVAIGQRELNRKSLTRTRFQLLTEGYRTPNGESVVQLGRRSAIRQTFARGAGYGGFTTA